VVYCTEDFNLHHFMDHEYNTNMGFEVYMAANIRIMALCFITVS
jgi:hypothetical protein